MASGCTCLEHVDGLGRKTGRRALNPTCPIHGSASLREPQIEPADHCWTVLQDHGAADGGWGPAGIVLPWISAEPRLFVYTGSDEKTIAVIKDLCMRLAQDTGKPTLLARYTQREDVFKIGGAS